MDTVARTAHDSIASVEWLHGATEAGTLPDAWGASSVFISTLVLDNGIPLHDISFVRTALFAKPQALNPGSLDHTGRRLRRILRQGIEHNTHYVLSFFFVPVVWRSALKVGDALCPRQASRLHLQQGALGGQGIDAEHRGGRLSSPPCRRDQPAQTTRDAPSSIRLCRFCGFGARFGARPCSGHRLSLTQYGMASRAATRRTECLPCMRGSCDLVECCPQQVALNHSASPVVRHPCYVSPRVQADNIMSTDVL